MKPFIKWLGGKSSLFKSLEQYFPNDLKGNDSKIYVEPFLGGGSVLFNLLTPSPTYNLLSSGNYSFHEIYINDMNADLVNCYSMIKENCPGMIDGLSKIRDEFNSTGVLARLSFYLGKREEYNKLELKDDPLRKAVLFIFLNKTCFNGLYRVNKQGKFNAAFNKTVTDLTFFEESNLREISNAFKDVKIFTGSYKDIADKVSDLSDAFFYLDPPYKQVVKTKFTGYSTVKEPFGDKEQEKLKEFCDYVSSKGSEIMESNSYCPEYFGSLYKKEDGYSIDAVVAARKINCKADERQSVHELVIRNY